MNHNFKNASESMCVAKRCTLCVRARLQFPCAHIFSIIHECIKPLRKDKLFHFFPQFNFFFLIPK